MTAKLATLAVALAACTPKPEPSVTETPQTDGGSTDTTDGPGIIRDTGPSETTEPTTPEVLTPIPTYSCPAPPSNARVFRAGTVVAEQAYTNSSYEHDLTETYGWDISPQNGLWLIATGISYTHHRRCRELVRGNRFQDEVKNGDRPGEFFFDLMVFLPYLDLASWLGEHTLDHGVFTDPDNVGHALRIGWRDAGDPHPMMVNSLPNGWTQSKICIGTISPDYVYMTVLWDPVDGPYRTNDFVRTDQPIWFDMEIWRSGGGDPTDVEGSDHRSCASTHWAFGEYYWKGTGPSRPEDLFAGYDWPGRHD